MPDVLRSVGLVEFKSHSADPPKASSGAEGPFAALMDLQGAARCSTRDASPGQGRLANGDGRSIVVDADLEHLQRELRTEASRLLANARRQRLPR